MLKPIQRPMHMTPHTVQRFTVRKQPTHCHILACGTATRHDKPYCTEHVERHAYVQEVLTTIAIREAEEKAINLKGWRVVDINGSIAQEILQLLDTQGERSIRRMAQEMSRIPYIQAQYIEALRRAGLVTITRSPRGISIVQANPAAYQATY